MARKPAAAADRPVKILRPEIRLYETDADLMAYFAQFPARSQPAAIKRAIRAALSGGSLGLGAQPASVTDDSDDFSDFVT